MYIYYHFLSALPIWAVNAIAESTTEAPSKLDVPSVNVKINASTAGSDDSADKEQLKEVNSYTHMLWNDFRNAEHTVFTKAKQNLLKVNHDKVAKVCKME